jgi:prevent-host-death family protein
MNCINLREARRRLGAIVDAAERGQTTVITRRGRKVARVEPIGPAKRKPLPDLSEFRASIKAEGKPLSQTVIRRRKEGRY